VAFSYLHANVIDIMGTTTITISIIGGLIKAHAEFIKKMLFSTVEKFLSKGQNKL
jgi:hypothetical protein